MTRPNHEDNQYKATGSVQDSLKSIAPTTSNNVFNTGSTDDQLNTSTSDTSNISSARGHHI